jgi:hypothetical protein
MIAATPDWRWGVSGERTAWYPSMRLFRQAVSNDWDGVIENVGAELAKLAASEEGTGEGLRGSTTSKT